MHWFRPFKKGNGIRYRSVACSENGYGTSSSSCDATGGAYALWVPRLFVVCAITGKCILDSEGGPTCTDLSALGRIAISSKGIYEGLCADAPKDEMYIQLSNGELLTYVPQESKLGYCAFAPKGRSFAWLPALKELYKKITQCAKWLSSTETLLQENADAMLSRYTASTMASAPVDEYDHEDADQRRLLRLIAEVRDSTKRQLEEIDFWGEFRRIRRKWLELSKDGDGDYPMWIFRPSLWRVALLDLWMEVQDGEREIGARMAPLENNVEEGISVDADYGNITVFRIPEHPPSAASPSMAVLSPSIYECGERWRDQDAIESTASCSDEHGNERERDCAVSTGFQRHRMKICSEDPVAEYGLTPTKPAGQPKARRVAEG